MIHKTRVLRCPQQRAFELFTQAASTWWPADRRHTGDPNSAIEMHASGRFVERSGAGEEVELGRITLWDAPNALEVDFYVASGPQAPTRLRVTFTPEGAHTRITIQHGPGPRSQEVWTQRATAYEASWNLLLDSLERFAVEHA